MYYTVSLSKTYFQDTFLRVGDVENFKPSGLLNRSLLISTYSPMHLIDSFISAIYFHGMLNISKHLNTKCFPREQSEVLSQWVGSCRYLYNCALEHRIYMYERGVRVSEYDQSNELKVIKRTEGLEFFKLVPAQCLQQTLKRLNRAYQNFSGLWVSKYRKKGDGDSLHFPTPSHFEIKN